MKEADEAVRALGRVTADTFDDGGWVDGCQLELLDLAFATRLSELGGPTSSQRSPSPSVSSSDSDSPLDFGMTAWRGEET